MRVTLMRVTRSLTMAMLQDWYLKRGKYREQKICVNHYAEVMRDVLECYLNS